jgi:hypothetical protein
LFGAINLGPLGSLMAALLELASIADRGLRRTFAFGPGFKHRAQLFGAHKSAADIFVFRTGIERNQPIAVLAVGLEPVADFLRPLSEYLRALRAFDFYFVVGHETPLLNGGILLSAG